MESERERALTVLQGQYAKMLESAMQDGDTVAIAKLKEIREKFLAAADFKDAIGSARNELQDLDSTVKRMEAEIDSDGGWFASVIGVNSIEAEIDKKLPAIRAKMLNCGRKLYGRLTAVERCCLVYHG